MKIPQVLFLASLCPVVLHAQEAAVDLSDSDEGDIIRMPSLHVVGAVAANDTPSAGFATAVTALRFDPAIDIQSRGFAETQSDIVIRGGIFSNSGLKVGAVTLTDPQTGHSYSELPIDPIMLSTPSILTGADNTLSGFNSSVGTVEYHFLPIAAAGTLEGGFGEDNLYFTRMVTGWKSADDFFAGRSLGIQTAAAYSRGDGTIDNAGHRFQRYGLRLQLSDQNGQTDLYGGYQKKTYGWPGMYTGRAAYDEGEKYEVAIAILNHTQTYGEGSHWSFGAYGRQFLDDYELKRSIPGYFRPYQHQSHVYGAALEGTHNFDEVWSLAWQSQAQADSLKSTDLIYGRFMSRSYWKQAAELGRKFNAGEGEILVQAGAAYEDTNRDSGSGSPIAKITFTTPTTCGTWTTYAEYSRATQVADYTALNSKPGNGSFAGNAFLPRERTDNYELGIGWDCGKFRFGSSVFRRRHHDLADWVYDSTKTTTFRVVDPMDMTVLGTDTYVAWVPVKALSVSVGYAWLESDADYNRANVDASFYAMNYPRHRATTSIKWAIFKNLELRVDAEGRMQEKNARRTSGSDALFVNASLAWSPDFLKGLSVSVIADNLTDCDFEDFPGSPADRRQFALRTSYIW